MKRLLLGSSALLCLGLSAGPALAACTSTSPNAGQTVDCTGASSTAVLANPGQNNITVNVQDGATLTVATGKGIGLYGGSTINLFGSGAVNTSAVSGIGLSMFGSDDTITLNGTSHVTTTGLGAATAAGIFGNNAKIEFRDDSVVSTTGIGAFGAFVAGTDASITLSGNAHVSTTGQFGYGIANSAISGGRVTLTGTSDIHTTGVSAYGVAVQGDGQVVSLGDAAAIQTTGVQGDGIHVVGSNEIVTLNDTASILTHGATANAIKLQGAHDSISILGLSQIHTINSQSFGAYIDGAYGSILFNNQTNYATTYGSQSTGAYIKGDHGVITLNGASPLITLGNTADAAKIAGNYGGITLNDTSALATNNNASIGAELIGDHSTITLNGGAAIFTTGSTAAGAYATGNDDRIILNDSSKIATSGSATAGAGVQGQNNQIVLNGTSTIVTSGTGEGVFLNGNFNSLDLQDQSSIDASGAGGNGVLLQGTFNTMVVGKGASVTTTGVNSHAIVNQGSAVIQNLGLVETKTGVAILGDNNAANSDTVVNAGRILGGGGTAIDLQDGDDHLTLSTGSQITGSIDGGAGNDTLNLLGAGSEDDVFLNFETLSMNGQNWSLSGNSSFGTIIAINKGRLAINGTIAAPSTTVGSSGILGGNGTLVSDVTSVGTIAPGNSVGTLTINGNFSQGGGAFDVEFDKSGVDRLNVLGAGGATLANSPSLNVINYGGASGGAGIILHAPNGITGSFGTVTYQGNGAATVSQTATDISLITVDGTPVVGSAFAASETGLDYLDAVNDEQLAGLKNCGTDSCDRAAAQRFHLWAKGFGRFGDEAAAAGDQSFDYRIAGTAVGGDMAVADGLRLGLSFGYSNTEEDVTQHAASADIDTTQAALYANYQHGPYFVTGQVSGGWQHYDQSRVVGTGGGNDSADSTTDGWLFGSSLQAGARFGFPKGWWLTPSAGVSYQHQWINGTTEHGGGAADVGIASHQADALRLKAQLVLSQDYQLTGYTITPHLKLGVQQQYNLGGHAEGAFSDGTDFSLAMTDNSRTMGLAGVGVQVAFENGLSTYVDYDGALASGRTVQSITGGLRYSW